MVTPVPGAPGAGRGRQPGPSGEGGFVTALTARSGVTGGRQSSLIILAISVALGIAVFGAWFTVAGHGRAMLLSLARRRSRRTR